MNQPTEERTGSRRGYAWPAFGILGWLLAGALFVAQSDSLRNTHLPPYETCTVEHRGFTVETRRSFLTGTRMWRLIDGPASTVLHDDWIRADRVVFLRTSPPDLEWRGGYTGSAAGFEIGAYNPGLNTISGARVTVSHVDGTTVTYDLRGSIQPNTYGTMRNSFREVVPNAVLHTWSLTEIGVTLPPPPATCRGMSP